MSVALAGRVTDAVDSLGPAERRALSMREKDRADYRAIAEELEVRREGVADLLVSARLTVWSQLHDTAFPPRPTPQCGPARRVLAAQGDGETVGAADSERAREHLAGCAPCAAARLALREAELACRTWAATPPSALLVGPPLAPLPSRRDPLGRVAVRLRMIGAAVGLVLVLIFVVARIAGSGDGPPAPAAPKTGPGSAQGSGRDVIPPPGDKFCPAQQPDCK